jgi:hypothetical protein
VVKAVLRILLNILRWPLLHARAACVRFARAPLLMRLAVYALLAVVLVLVAGAALPLKR